MKITRCYKCICNACTKFYCPHIKTRCINCNVLNKVTLYDCDFFENKLTAPRRYRIKRKIKPSSDSLNQKLDFIIECLGRGDFKAMPADGTYAVYWKGQIIFQGSKDQANSFKERLKNEFSSPLKVERLKINI